METKEIYHAFEQLKVVPVIAIEEAEKALPLADALIEGGLPVAEITFRTDAAAEVMLILKRERPTLLLGAGTILTLENLKKARDSGAEFGVAPGFNPKIVEAAVKMGFPFLPGIMTPSDIEVALEFGINTLKFFPAEAAGGVALLKGLAAPYNHLGVKFIPTGGIKPDNMKDYIEIPQVMAVGGTWVAKKDDIGAGNWDKIKKNCRQIRDLLD